MSEQQDTGKPFRVRILWGSAPEEGDEPITYEFGTEAEFNAFMEGVDAAVGWLDHQIIEEEGADA